MEKIKLVDAIAHLRRELYAANQAGKNEGLKLEIGAIDVEFEIEIEKHGDLGAEISFNVVVADGKAKAGGDLHSAHTHRVKLHLKPTMDGENVSISDRAHRQDD